MTGSAEARLYFLTDGRVSDEVSIGPSSTLCLSDPNILGWWNGEPEATYRQAPGRQAADASLGPAGGDVVLECSTWASGARGGRRGGAAVAGEEGSLCGCEVTGQRGKAGGHRGWAAQVNGSMG